jgi:hypothetical protein
MKTRAEIIFKVLAILTGGDVGTNPSNEDAAAVDGYIDSEVAELAQEEIYIPDPDTLDDDLFVPFCKLVAENASEEFTGIKANPQLMQYWRNRIRVLRRPRPGFGPIDAEYF